MGRARQHDFFGLGSRHFQLPGGSECRAYQPQPAPSELRAHTGALRLGPSGAISQRQRNHTENQGIACADNASLLPAVGLVRGLPGGQLRLRTAGSWLRGLAR
jgi:hypothetical protein